MSSISNTRLSSPSSPAQRTEKKINLDFQQLTSAVRRNNIEKVKEFINSASCKNLNESELLELENILEKNRNLNIQIVDLIKTKISQQNQTLLFRSNVSNTSTFSSSLTTELPTTSSTPVSSLLNHTLVATSKKVHQTNVPKIESIIFEDVIESIFEFLSLQDNANFSKFVKLNPKFSPESRKFIRKFYGLVLSSWINQSQTLLKKFPKEFIPKGLFQRNKLPKIEEFEKTLLSKNEDQILKKILEVIAFVENNSNILVSNGDRDIAKIIHLVCEYGLIHFARILLKLGVDPNSEIEQEEQNNPHGGRSHSPPTWIPLTSPHRFGTTPLHLVSNHGYMKLVQLLIQAGAHPSSLTAWRDSPVQLAAKNGHFDVVQFLVANKAKSSEELIKEAIENNSPLLTGSVNIGALYSALESGQIVIAQFLLDHGFILDDKDTFEKCPLRWATLRGDYDRVKLLLEENNFDLNRAPWGPGDHHPLFIWAIICGHIDIAQAFLHAGAHVNQFDGYNMSALNWAARLGNEEALEFLLNAQADVEGSVVNGKQKKTALHFAAEYGQTHIIRRLLQHKAKADIKQNDGFFEEDGYTPLHYAVENNHLESVLLLLSAGANIDEKATNGENSLCKAARKGLKEMIKLLIGKYAELNIPIGLGGFALAEAAYSGQIEIVLILLQEGIDPNLTLYGKTPLQFAKERGHWEIVKLLALKTNQTFSGKIGTFFSSISK